MLADVVLAMRPALDARGCPVPVFLGEQYLRDSSGEPRIVIVPTTDTFGPRDISVRPGTPGSSANVGMVINPRIVATRITGAIAHFWGFGVQRNDPEQVLRDHAFLDRMIETFLATINGLCQGVLTIGGGAYQLDQAIHDRLGLAYQLTFSVAIPVRDVAWPDGVTTYREEPAHAHVLVQELLGDPQTYQIGAEFDAPDIEEAPTHFPD